MILPAAAMVASTNRNRKRKANFEDSFSSVDDLLTDVEDEELTDEEEELPDENRMLQYT